MTLRVDWRAATSLVGTVLKWLAVPLLFPLSVALYYGEPVLPFVATILVTVVLGLLVERLDPDPTIGPREGFLMVSLTWLAVAAVGAIPYVVAGRGAIALPVHALFESMSGVTTTGATVMQSISFTAHSRAILMWRQESQWLGGMGIVVLAVAILPKLTVGGAQLMDAEAPGPGIQKLTPRIAETARALWVAYLGITALEVVLLLALHVAGLAPRMTVYEAVAHGFTTMATGGFSPEARSVEAFSAAVQWLVIPFMVAAGTNFALFWHVLEGEPDHLVRDREFRFYLGIIGVLSAVLAVLLFADAGLPGIGGHPLAAVRQSLFQVASIVTTTGFASTDFNGWNDPAQTLLFVAMFVGGSAGSTGGSIKVIRWLVVFKAARRELFTTVHPEAVRPVRVGGRVIDERAIRGIYAFTLLYFLSFLFGTLFLLVDASVAGLSLQPFVAMSAVAATLGNVGPGFGLVGPMSGYAAFPNSSKLLMVVLMWVGRLEILPVLVLLSPMYWRS